MAYGVTAPIDPNQINSPSNVNLSPAEPSGEVVNPDGRLDGKLLLEGDCVDEERKNIPAEYLVCVGKE